LQLENTIRAEVWYVLAENISMASSALSILEPIPKTFVCSSHRGGGCDGGAGIDSSDVACMVDAQHHGHYRS